MANKIFCLKNNCANYAKSNLTALLVLPFEGTTDKIARLFSYFLIGELHGLYQKQYQGHEMDHRHAQKELGDLLWFIAEWCTSYGLSLEDIMQMNIDKLRARYPEWFDAEHSLHRKEWDV